MSTSRAIHPLVETLIIGGGPSGLATALGLARARRQVIIFDSGKYRNAHVEHMHNVSTWDHANPADYRAKARKELTEGRYKTVQIKNTTIANVVKNAEGIFEATDTAGEMWQGKTLVMATGITDVMPPIPGYKECWEMSKIYHCLYCHGYEDSGCESAGVIAGFGPTAVAHNAVLVSKLAAQFANRVVVYTNGLVELAKEIQESTKSNPKITIDTRPIEGLVPESNSSGEPAVKLGASGDKPAVTVTHRFFVHGPEPSANVGIVKSLGLELTESKGEINTTAPFNETNVPGCYAVGDVGTPLKAVSVGISIGTVAAVGVNMNLI